MGPFVETESAAALKTQVAALRSQFKTMTDEVMNRAEAVK